MAGGEGEVGGNGSVWWNVCHYDDATPGTKRRLRARTAPSGLPAVDEVGIDDEITGHDSTPVADVGKRVGHPGKFVVTLRYKTKEEAEAAAKEATASIKTGRDGYYMQVLVPAIDRTTPNENPPKEVKVDW